MQQDKTRITVEVSVLAPVEKVWQLWTLAEHIEKWNNASDEWHTPHATNDLRAGGRFVWRMEAKDGSFGFDFGGTYDVVIPQQYVAYTLDDERKVTVDFIGEGHSTKIIESFEAEDTNPVEMQKNGWQAIMNNFKKYAEIK